MRRRAGWVFIDAVAAMLLLSILTLMLGIAAGAHHRGLTRLIAVRAASHLAEASLLTLQQGATLSAQKNAPVSVESLAPDDSRGPDTWVRVTARVEGRSASLIGLVPRAATRPSEGAQ